MKILKALLYGALTIIIILLVAIQFLGNYMNGSEKQANKLFREQDYAYSFNHTDSLRWIETGNRDSRTMIFWLHGSPGSWMDFSSFLVDDSLQQLGQMVAMDRPGYGGSTLGHPQSSIITQANMAESIINTYNYDSLIIIGYSYGTPVAVELASRSIAGLSGLMLLAPVISPDHEPIFWFNKLLAVKPLYALLPAAIRSAQIEKMSHTQALNDIRTHFSKITVPVVHVHGEEDWVAPFEANTTWAKEQIKAPYTLISWPDSGHFFPNTITEKIQPLILDMVNYAD